jgi:hypothetical protein
MFIKNLCVLVLSFLGGASCYADCEKEVLETKNYIRSEFEIPISNIRLELTDTCLQMEYTGMPLLEAAKSANWILFNDKQDPESPMALFIDFAFHELGVPVEYPASDKVIAHAKKMLRGYLKSKNSFYGLVPMDEGSEGGEDPRENWLFKLSLKEFSDHMFWIVVPREREKLGYIYGFN